MRAEFAGEGPIEVELEKGGGGIFDVHRDGELVFSKHEHGRFPEPGEIVGLLR